MRTRIRQAIVSSSMLVLLGAGPAAAEMRTTSFAVFMHVGPGRQYAVSDELQVRTPVDVLSCAGDWCQVRVGRATGWIDGRMLASAAPPAPGTPSRECFDFARTGWPNKGDRDRLCSHAPAEQPAPAR